MPSLGYQALMLLSWILVVSKETDESIGRITRLQPDDDGGGAEATIRKGRDGYAVAVWINLMSRSIDR